MPNAIVLLADGFETAEALTVVDVLRGAGIRTRTVSVMDTRQVISAQQVQVGADESLANCQLEIADCVVVPGGMPAARRLARDMRVIDLLRDAMERRIVAASGAGSLVLSFLGLLTGRAVATYAGADGGRGDERALLDEPVVVDDNLITARDLASAPAFSLMIVQMLAGEQAARKTSAGIGTPLPSLS